MQVCSMNRDHHRGGGMSAKPGQFGSMGAVCWPATTKDSLWVSPTDRGTHSCPILMLMGQVIECRIARSPHSSAMSVAKR